MSTIGKLRKELADSRSQVEVDDMPISVKDVFSLLTKIDPSKSSGPDELPGYLLKEGAEWIAGSLTNLFSMSLSQGTQPYLVTGLRQMSPRSSRKVISTSYPTTDLSASPV